MCCRYTTTSNETWVSVSNDADEPCDFLPANSRPLNPSAESEIRDTRHSHQVPVKLKLSAQTEESSPRIRRKIVTTLAQKSTASTTLRPSQTAFRAYRCMPLRDESPNRCHASDGAKSRAPDPHQSTVTDMNATSDPGSGSMSLYWQTGHLQGA